MTELIWEGKYDKDGRKAAPLRVALPFQTVETVNESAQQRQKALDFFSAGRESEWRNRLIWGDKKYVLPSLLPEFAGKVNLIYIDPPFATGADFSYTASIPDDPEAENGNGASFVKEASVIEQKAYRDTWGRGLDSYLKWFYETAILLRELLAENGSIYVHLDWHVGYYAKAILDEVFGWVDNFKNEIVWRRSYSHNDGSRFGIITDSIFWFTKSNKWIYNKIFIPRTDEETTREYPNIDEHTGKRFKSVSMNAAGQGEPRYFGERGLLSPPIGRHWVWSQERIKQALEENIIYFSSNGVPRYKQFVEDIEGKQVQNLWTDFMAVSSQANELLNYPTQKPEALLERIIKTSSNEGDLVLDCFCGSGTTTAVAEKLNRRWIACDLGRFAIHTTRKRLLQIPNVRPFVVQNLGKYERQVWQKAEFGERAEAAMQSYRHFILDLYHARPINGYAWLHGLKNGRMAHVGTVDSPVSVGDVKSIAIEFRRAMGSGENAPSTNGIDVLGWDFAFELNEVARQQAELAKINMRFLRIPREVLEKRAVEQGDIRFFELAALAVEPVIQGRTVTLKLTDFVIPVDDVPAEVQQKITHWSQWIDYWAVDWDNRDDTFHNEWQTYRTRKDNNLQKQVAHSYEAPGEYMVVVKVIDILGNDTTKTIRVKVA